MKKAFSVFLSFCLCTITMLGFTACGDDEHEDKHEHGRRTDLVDEFGEHLEITRNDGMISFTSSSDIFSN